MKQLFIGTFCSLALTLGIGCGGDDKDTDGSSEESAENLPADCNIIREACHADDEGNGIAHQCHEIAHDGNAAMCTAKKAECLAGCH